ncbi:MAG: MarR family winged helix-turn-helix transcriptional regulator [Acidimicrobiales bacterium]
MGEDVVVEHALVGTGRHLDGVDLRIWTSLVDLSRILDTELEKQLVSNHQMTHREYEILVRLDGAGGRKRMLALAREIEASAPLITQTVAKLEARGWITRQASIGDGRGVDAVLLDEGMAALAEAAEPHASLIQSLLLDHIPDHRRIAMSGLLGAIADHLREHRAGQECARADCPLNLPVA